jgi:serine/threonine protein kinase
MRKKDGIPFEQHFPNAEPAALLLLKRLLAFDPAERPTAEEALADPYFAGLSQPSREPSAMPISKIAFEFERRKLTTDEVRELIYREILEYHPQMLADYLAGDTHQPNFVYPSAVDHFKRQFQHLEAGGKGAHHALGQSTSLPRERIPDFRAEASRYLKKQAQTSTGVAGHDRAQDDQLPYGTSVDMHDAKAIEMLGSSVEQMHVGDDYHRLGGNNNKATSESRGYGTSGHQSSSATGPLNTTKSSKYGRPSSEHV